MILLARHIRESRRLPVAVAVVLGAVLVVQAGRTAAALTQAPDFDTPTAPAPPADLGVLARFDPFRGDGEAGHSEAAGGWTLFAIRSGASGLDTAIIAGADGQQRLYRVGEALAPGVLLDSVAADHVRLSRGGVVSRLDFPETSAAPAPVAPPAPAPASAAPQGGRISATRFTTDVALSPRQRDGRIDGVTVQPRGQGAALQAAGLRPGDVILAVNGTPVDSAERVADLALDLQAGARAEITYERDGRRLATTVDIEGPDRR